MKVRVNINDIIYNGIDADTVINALNAVIIGNKIIPEEIYHISGIKQEATQ